MKKLRIIFLEIVNYTTEKLFPMSKEIKKKRRGGGGGESSSFLSPIKLILVHR